MKTNSTLMRCNLNPVASGFGFLGIVVLAGCQQGAVEPSPQFGHTHEVAYFCPMRCEKEKSYDKPGKCPKCNMQLVSKQAHADHSPKHGGHFNMAKDNWHHVEATLPSLQQLRIYLYDNFTHLVKPAKYSGTVKVQPVDDQGEERGEAISIPIQPVAGEDYLAAKLPEEIQLPLQVQTRLRFPKIKEGKPDWNEVGEFQFDFDFTKIMHKD